jgi:hypothetical protein
LATDLSSCANCGFRPPDIYLPCIGRNGGTAIRLFSGAGASGPNAGYIATAGVDIRASSAEPDLCHRDPPQAEMGRDGLAGGKSGDAQMSTLIQCIVFVTPVLEDRSHS